MKKVIHENKEAGIRQTFHMNDEGDITLQTEQDVRAIIADNKRELDNSAGEKWGDMRKVARIPIAELLKLVPLGILDEKLVIRDHKRFAAWLNDADNRAFRTFAGRV